MELIFVFSSEDTLQQLHNMRQPPGVVVIFLAINMPGINGLELLQTIKKNFPAIRVSMIIAYSDRDYEAAMDFGADDYYTKPLDFSRPKKNF